MVVIGVLFAIPIVFVLSVSLYVRLNPQFGGRITKSDIERYRQSPNWDGKKFVNRSETTVSVGFKNLPKVIYRQFSNTKVRQPQHRIKIPELSHSQWQINPEMPKYVWYGHATLLLQIKGKNILIDPMFGPDAAPIGPFKVKRFSDNTLDIIDQLPKIDLVIFSHDHYDHLDYKSVQKLKSNVDLFYVALGVERHLKSWGIPEHQIHTFDWWDDKDFDDISIRFTESRHFSGRGLTDRTKSLWGGWIFKTDKHNIYWSGDGGYDTHFKEIGETYGPFDLGFMECGQYNEFWKTIHMFPDEAVQAAKDSGVKVAVPVHWGGFALSSHTWKHPVEEFTKFATEQGQSIATPEPGAIVKLTDQTSTWWE